MSKSVRRRLGPTAHLERDCSCSGATIRAAKRSARAFWQREAANDADDAADIRDGWCPPYCPCGVDLDEWLEWLRSRPVYPEPVLAVPLIDRCA